MSHRDTDGRGCGVGTCAKCYAQDFGATCSCPGDDHVLSCPWVRGRVNGEWVGHVRDCPLNGGPCPCLPGSTAEAYCHADATERLAALDDKHPPA